MAKNMDSLSEFTGVELEVVAEGVARAIRGSRKFATAEHEAALKWICANSAPASLASNIARIGNVSAIRQDLEKAGLVNGTTSAFAVAVGNALDKLAEERK